nr:hypothetical protein [Tanacetum cinerariifolium]
MVPDQFWIEEECKYDIDAMYGISHWWFQRQRFYIDRHTSEGDRSAVRTHMRILSVVRIEVFSMYGLVPVKPSRSQTQLNLTKPQWDATGYEYKHDYTVIDSPRAAIFRDKYEVQMMIRVNEIHKFSDGTLQQIDEALDYRIKEFRINRMNPAAFEDKEDLPQPGKLFHSSRALSALRRFGLRTASTAVKPYQGDSSEFYLITGIAAADQMDVNSQLHAHQSNSLSMTTKIPTTQLSARSSVLVNGSPTDEFELHRGLRQGDPLSHFLFILAIEGLHAYTSKAESLGLFKGCSVGRDNLYISHLMYADDVIFIEVLFEIIILEGASLISWRTSYIDKRLKDHGIDLFSFCTRKVGNGHNTSFWIDVWCGNQQLKALFTRIFNLDLDKRCSIANRLVVQDCSSVLRRRPSGGADSVQLDALTSFIGSFSLSDRRDCWVWSLGGNEGFSVASVHGLVDSVMLDNGHVATPWNQYLPIKVRIKEHKDKEIKKGMRNRNSCSLCGGTDHNKRTCTSMFKDQDEVVVAQDEVVQEKVDLIENEEELI